MFAINCVQYHFKFSLNSFIGFLELILMKSIRSGCSATTVIRVTPTKLTNNQDLYCSVSPQAKKLKFYCFVVYISLAEERCWNLLFPFCFVIVKIVWVTPITVVTL